MLATFPILISHIWLVAAVLDHTNREHFHLCGKFLYNAALGKAYILDGWMEAERTVSEEKRKVTEVRSR